MDMRPGTATPPPTLRGIPIIPGSALRTPARAGVAALPQSPCDSCNVRQLCLPASLDAASNEVLRRLLIGRRRLRKGQVLYRAGDPFLFLYAVRFGTLKSALRL